MRALVKLPEADEGGQREAEHEAQHQVEARVREARTARDRGIAVDDGVGFRNAFEFARLLEAVVEFLEQRTGRLGVALKRGLFDASAVVAGQLALLAVHAALQAADTLARDQDFLPER
jgi:hypothetical protein